MGLTLQEVLLIALKKLDDSSFQRFIENLSAQNVREEYEKLSKYDLTGKDPDQVADMINLYYSYAYGAEVTLNVLEDIGQKKVREELQKDLREVDVSGHGLGTAIFTDGVHFISNHQINLFTRITNIDPVLRELRGQGVLTQQQYNEVMEKTTSYEKMRELCEIILFREPVVDHWYVAYQLLREYNQEVFEYLEVEDMRRINTYWCFSGHVVDRNRSYLINHIKEVQPVLEDLRSHHLLTEEQYKDLQAMRTPKEKMTRLFDIFFLQSYTVKDQFYVSLWRYNFTVINKLEKAEKVGKRPKAGGHFIDRQKEQLITGIREVYWVIRDLHRKSLLTTEQRDDLLKRSHAEEPMRRLYDIISDWDEDDKQEVYFSFYEHNSWIIKQLKRCEDSSTLVNSGGHFIDRHKEQLITKIRNLDPVISDLHHGTLLTREHYDDLLKISDTKNRMRHLCDIISDWDEDDKEEVFFSLQKYNPGIIKQVKKCEDSSTLKKSGDHFIDRHKEELITGIRDVHPVIYDLNRKSLLTREQRNDLLKISDTKDRMRRLFDIISDWDEDAKQEVYFSLNENNPRIIQDLKQREDSSTLEKTGILEKHRLDLISRVIMVDPILDDLRDQGLLEHKLHDILRREPLIRKKMTDLLDTVSKWEDYPKRKFFKSLCAHNPSVIKDLQNDDMTTEPDRKHFVDDHCWDLIQSIIMVDPVIDDLLENNLVTQEQYDAFISLKTPEKKMMDLYFTVRSWTDHKKDQFYLALRQHNPAFIRVLEKSDQKLKAGNTTGEHFLDKNKSGLINVMNTVDPVVEDLREEGLLTKEQYRYILLKGTSREKMAEIYNITNSFDNVKKDKVYLALRTHNRSHIRVMERISSSSLSVSKQSGKLVERKGISFEEDDNQEVWVAPESIRCSICIDVYKEPVTLICGHTFCLKCIEETWNNKENDDMICPLCMRRFAKRPELSKNLVVSEIAEFFQKKDRRRSKNQKMIHS